MTWSASLIELASDPGNGNIIATIQYNNTDGRGFTPAPLVGNGLTDAIIKQQMAKVISVLNARDAAFAAITLRPSATPVDLTGVSATDPAIQSSLAYQQYLGALSAMNVVQSAVTAGIVKNTDPVFTQAQSNLSTAKNAMTTVQSVQVGTVGTGSISAT